MEHIFKVEPAELPRARGYVHGMSARGHWLHVAGQIGWELDGSFAALDMVHQFGRALDNVLAVIREAGGQPTDLVSMTVYVTDLDAYRGSARELGEAWRARLGRHYPAMALVGVAGLVHPLSTVEIQAVACLAETRE